jgi:hypothetical protein
VFPSDSEVSSVSKCLARDQRARQAELHGMLVAVRYAAAINEHGVVNRVPSPSAVDLSFCRR